MVKHQQSQLKEMMRDHKRQTSIGEDLYNTNPYQTPALDESKTQSKLIIKNSLM